MQSPAEDPHLAASGYHASSFCWYRLGQRVRATRGEG